MKIRIPSETIEVDPAKWAFEFGIDERDVRTSVQLYFHGRCQEKIAELCLEPSKNGGDK